MSFILILALVVFNLVLLLLAIVAVRLLRSDDGPDGRHARLRSDELFAYDSWSANRPAAVGSRPRSDAGPVGRRTGA